MRGSLVAVIFFATICLVGCHRNADCAALIPSEREQSVTSQETPATKTVKVKAKGGEYCKVIDILQQDSEWNDSNAPYYAILAPTGFGVDMGWHMQSFRKKQVEQLKIGKVYFFELSCSDIFEITEEELIKERPNSSHNNRVIFNYDNFVEVELEKDFDPDKLNSYWELVE